MTTAMDEVLAAALRARKVCLAMQTESSLTAGDQSQEQKRSLLVPELSPDFLEKHGIFKRYQQISFDTLEARGIPADIVSQWDTVRNYALHLRANIDDGMGLILAGGVGRMKTTLAVAVLRELLENDDRHSGYMIPMASLLDNLYTMRSLYKEEAARYEERIRRCDLLVIDDLGAENATAPWILAKVDSIIAERYNRMKPVIITTNLNQQDLAGTYGGRIIDRLRSTSKFIAFNGRSLRGMA